MFKCSQSWTTERRKMKCVDISHSFHIIRFHILTFDFYNKIHGRIDVRLFELKIILWHFCVTRYSIPSLSETSFAALTRYSSGAICEDKRTRFLSSSMESMRTNALSPSARAFFLWYYPKETFPRRIEFNINYRTHALFLICTMLTFGC